MNAWRAQGRRWLLSGWVLLVSGCSGGLEDPAPSVADESLELDAQSLVQAKQTIDLRRSLAVTDKTILARFPLKRVFDQLVGQSGVSGVTSVQLFHQWWDTQNAVPGLGLGAHCNDSVDAAGNPIFNSYPYACRPTEGAQAATDPFSSPETNPDAYEPIGLFNRFDLAPQSGANCGEHRIVYAKRSGIGDAFQRNLVIFEAVLPNPRPDKQILGCKEIVKFWANLSLEKDIDKRAAALEDFYFLGLPGSGGGPVVHVSNYGDNALGAGQIRTNQFTNPAGAISPQVSWVLREFKLLRSCVGGACSALRFVPATVKVNPFGGLFSPSAIDPASPAFHPNAQPFQQGFPEAIADFAGDDLNRFQYSPSDVMNTGQSLASGSSENNYVGQLGVAPSAFRSAIQTQLTTLGSTLTPDHVARRVQALSCAGCHRLNNAAPNNDLGNGVVWPASQGFTHVSERDTEMGPDGSVRFRISDALTNVFLPHRKALIELFINEKPLPNKHPEKSIGEGSSTH